MMSFYPHAQPESWRTTLCRLSATAYSMHSQLPFISGGRLLHPQTQDAPCRGDKGPTSLGINQNHVIKTYELGYLSRHCDEPPAGRSGFDSLQMQEIFPYSTAFRPTPVGTVFFSSEAKRPGRAADHSPPSTPEVKNSGTTSISPIPPPFSQCTVLNELDTGTILPSHL
jgi:hypothetical protein